MLKKKLIVAAALLMSFTAFTNEANATCSNVPLSYRCPVEFNKPMDVCLADIQIAFYNAGFFPSQHVIVQTDSAYTLDSAFSINQYQAPNWSCSIAEGYVLEGGNQGHDGG